MLPYVPEQRTAAEWSASYVSGELDFYSGLDELGRYSVIVGYIGWARTEIGHPPSILDLGCGTGQLRRLLDDVAWTDYVGVDLAATAIASAREGPMHRTRFMVGDVMTLELGTLRRGRAQRGPVLRT